MMTKLDHKKSLKNLYNPTGKTFSVVEVPTMHFLMIDGEGDPNTVPAYKAAVEALYSVSYTLKFATKKQAAIDYAVMPLEGLWWSEDNRVFALDDRAAWQWTMMIMQPDAITAPMVEEAKVAAAKKKLLPALPKLRFEPFAEGLAVQIMYTGAYRDEAPVIARLHEFIRDNGYIENGHHHEIYLGDPNRTAPEKLKTVLRHPIRKQ